MLVCWMVGVGMDGWINGRTNERAPKNTHPTTQTPTSKPKHNRTERTCTKSATERRKVSSTSCNPWLSLATSSRAALRAVTAVVACPPCGGGGGLGGKRWDDDPSVDPSVLVEEEVAPERRSRSGGWSGCRCAPAAAAAAAAPAEAVVPVVVGPAGS